MKYQRTMPEDDQERNYKLVSEGEHKFTVTDIFKEDEQEITLKCEVISDIDNGTSIFYRLSNDDKSDFFWLTKLFLKCVGLAHNGSVVIDTDELIARNFYGEVKHTKGKDGKTYANIKKLIYKDEPQDMHHISKQPDDPKDIQVNWDN